MVRKKTREPSRRERQILDALYRLGEASVADVRDALPDPPSYSAVRGLLRVLSEKGQVLHRSDGQRYLYRPTLEPERARESAMRRLLETFFENSTEDAVAALLDLNAGDLSDEAVARLTEKIERASEEGR